jgi:hypothetical protein
MKVIAKQEGDNIYLIDTEEKDQGFIFDADEDLRFEKINKQSLLARGYWVETEDDPIIVKAAMNAKEV